MKFNVNQQDFQQALNFCQGVIEKRSTLPILSNILIDASNSNLIITATDLDLIFIHKLKNVEVLKDVKYPDWEDNTLYSFKLPPVLPVAAFNSILVVNSKFLAVRGIF